MNFLKNLEAWFIARIENDKALFDKFRLWLIIKLAGQQSVLINIDVINQQILLRDKRSLVLQVRIFNDPLFPVRDSVISTVNLDDRLR